MKKTLTFLLSLIVMGSISAQQSEGSCHKRPEPPKIEEIVKDLTPIQKKRLETVTQDSKKQVEKLRAELRDVRKQIKIVLDKEGDHADELFPLLDKEGTLKAEITKEMYRTRNKIDDILTKEQLAQFRSSRKAARHDCDKKSPTRRREK